MLISMLAKHQQHTNNELRDCNRRCSKFDEQIEKLQSQMKEVERENKLLLEDQTRRKQRVEKLEERLKCEF